MPWCLLFSMAGMLSLRSGLFLFYQEKRKSPSAVVSRGKTVAWTKISPPKEFLWNTMVDDELIEVERPNRKTLLMRLLRLAQFRLPSNNYRIIAIKIPACARMTHGVNTPTHSQNQQVGSEVPITWHPPNFCR